MKRIKCPCCGFYTFYSDDEVIADICPVCFWQYDEVAQDAPNKVIGANHVTLNEAQENYKKNLVSDYRFIQYIRSPLQEELPNNNK